MDDIKAPKVVEIPYEDFIDLFSMLSQMATSMSLPSGRSAAEVYVFLKALLVQHSSLEEANG